MAPKVTAEYKHDVRDRILDAAESLFSRQGYHETSMDEIVGESGLSKGAIYGYFKSKEELLLALQDRGLARALGSIEASFAPGDSARSKLEKAAGIAFSSLMGASKEACRMNLELSAEAPRIRLLMNRQDDRYSTAHSLIAEIVSEGVKAGEFRKGIDADTAASIMLAVVDGLALHWATTTRRFDWIRIRAELTSIILNGMLAESRKRNSGR